MTYIPDKEHNWNPEKDNFSWEKLNWSKTPNFNDFIERLKVWNGWVYQDIFVTKGKGMHISLEFVPVNKA